ncbi:dephospho-CoA kinase [Gayadomonas joobiniege]|uniref:dephospho-CoA kinase n=1 Tax=Gayadomonas joobiniege TaxID=1234606 RepID=UPI0003600258|nr:dephospho-CoA kinase [Gayadomonas joobiniege]
MSWVLGLTGGIGSGKSTVAKIFSEQSIYVVDADQIARDLVAPGSDCLKRIEQKFGAEVIDPATGGLNRAHLRQLIFADHSAKTWLNDLLHPRIREHMQIQCQQASSPYVVLMIPLLFENKLEHLTDRVLVTDCLPATQIKRTMARDKCDSHLVTKIMQSQIDREERLNRADDIISTEIDKKMMYTQVIEFHQKYLKLAAKKVLKGSLED